MILFTNVEQMLGIGVKFYFYNNSSSSFISTYTLGFLQNLSQYINKLLDIKI